MTVTSLLSSDILDIHYDEDHCWLYLDWKGPQHLELVQSAGEHILDCIQQTGVRKVLNDSTCITQTSWPLAQWVSDEYLPRVAQAGIERVAWVQSLDLSSRIHIDLMDDFAEQMPLVALFEDVAAAYTWLSAPNSYAA